MPAIDISKLATLDERDGGPPPAAGFAMPPASFAPPEAAFAPPPPPDVAPRFAPPGGEADDAVLGVERSTRAIRIANHLKLEAAARTTAARAPAPRPAAAAPAPPAKRGSTGVLVGVLAIVAVAAGVVVLVRREPAPPPARAGVSIKIIARDPVEVTIDGHAVGKTPLTLSRPRGATAIEIATPKVSRQVVPDHDQTIDVSP